MFVVKRRYSFTPPCFTYCGPRHPASGYRSVRRSDGPTTATLTALVNYVNVSVRTCSKLRTCRFPESYNTFLKSRISSTNNESHFFLNPVNSPVYWIDLPSWVSPISWIDHSIHPSIFHYPPYSYLTHIQSVRISVLRKRTILSPPLPYKKPRASMSEAGIFVP
jgi:hypothetical protein